MYNPRSRPTWRCRARSCRGMLNRSSMITSSAAASITGLPAGALRHLSCRASGCLQLQETRLLTEPWGARHGRFASRPTIMGQVLGIVYRCVATHLTKHCVGQDLEKVLTHLDAKAPEPETSSRRSTADRWRGRRQKRWFQRRKSGFMPILARLPISGT